MRFAGGGPAVRRRSTVADAIIGFPFCDGESNDLLAKRAEVRMARTGWGSSLGRKAKG
jgi:hypothetical protein